MNLTIEEAYEKYLVYVHSKKKPQTYRTFKSHLKNHFLPFFSGMKVNEITADKYLEWQEFILNKNYSYKYIKGLHACNVSFFNFLITFHGLDKNIPNQVGNFFNYKHEQKRIKIWNKKTFRKFIRKVEEPEYKLFFYLLYKTGLRLGEAIALTWEDIDLKKGTISVNKTISKEFHDGKRAITAPKSKSSIRTVQINLSLRFKLNNYKNNFPVENFVFGGKKPLSPTTIERKKNNACRKAKIEPIRLHDFRHSYASNLIRHHVPLEVVSKTLGHAKKSTTLDIYVHLSPEYEKRTRFVFNFL